MHTYFKNTFWTLILIASVVIINSSCNKQFDQPPVYVAPTVIANTTIKQLKALHATSGSLDLVSQDLIIRGIVIANDKSGNLYKTIVIQDATGGITLLLGGNNLFNTYPIGRELFVNCKGLYLGDYNRVIQLGGGIDATGTTPELADIPSSLFSKYIIKGSFGNIVTPRVVTPGNLGTNMQDTLLNTLVQINNVEFSNSDTGKTYALPNQNPPGTANFTIRDCSGGSITLRNSGYSAFAGNNVPNGNGSIVSVYTVFGNTKQLTIRDTADLKMYGARCNAGGGGGGGGGGGTGVLSDISAVRLISGPVPANTKITGIVISDRVSLNIQTQNLVLQQGNDMAGIVIRFASANPAHTFDVGDSIDVVISGNTVAAFGGVLQVSNVSLANATRISTGKVITPRVATIAQVNSNIAAWESTLVKMLNVTISSTTGANWGGTTKFTDASGNIDHFTRTGATGATFGTVAFPTSVRPSVTAIVSKFNTNNQVGIRNPTLDVQ